MSKQNIEIILSLIFWLEVTLAVVLGIKLLVKFWQPQASGQKTITPAMIRGRP